MWFLAVYIFLPMFVFYYFILTDIKETIVDMYSRIKQTRPSRILAQGQSLRFGAEKKKRIGIYMARTELFSELYSVCNRPCFHR